MSNFVDLKMRGLFSVGMVVFLTLLMVFSDSRITQGVILAILVTLSSIAIWEYAQILKAKELTPPLAWMWGVSSLWIISIHFSSFDRTYRLLPLFVIGVGVLILFTHYFNHIEGAVLHIASSFFGICYVAIPIGLMSKILYPVAQEGVLLNGRLWFVYLLAVTKIADVGAYFVGKLWGDEKLAPELSPAKTIVGAVAGIISSILVSLAFCYGNQEGWIAWEPLSFFEAAMLGGLLGSASQIGDLAESLLKRDAKIKDSNRWPGVGGVLDLLDSLLFTTPILYFYMQTIT